MTTTESLLQQGVAAAKAGNRAAARDLLLQVVSNDERNEHAWLWLSGVIDDPAEQRIALENVLDINPRNASALKGIAWLDAHHPRSQPTVPSPQTMSAPAPSAPVPAAHAPALPAQRLPAIVESWLPDEQSPCPYCGAHTTPNQQNCTFCKHSLMVPGEPRLTRSVFLFLLALIWDFISLGNLIACLLLFFFTVLAYQANRDAAGTATAPVGNLLFSAALWVIVTIVAIWVTVGLYRRQRWAYIVNGVAVALQLVAALVGAFVGVQLLQTLQEAIANQPQPVPPFVTATLATATTAIPLCGLLFVGVWVALSVLSYRDFYGQRMRVTTDLPERKADEHYNFGVAYKNRGMWYMAAREWEGAVKRRSSDADYHRALGLAYAQIKDYGRALRELQAATDMRPGDALLKEDRAMVEKMALQ